ncbi:phosphoribosylanthranilate isomerase [Arcanobacterium hippocoleae]
MNKNAKANEKTESVLIKFCGIRSESDVYAVNQVFAERRGNEPKYVGFICVPGRRRFVEADKILRLRELLDSRVRTVGVFQDAPISAAAAVVESGAVDTVQLHGNESAKYIRQLRETLDCCGGAEIVQAFGIRTEADVKAANESSADIVLCDAFGGGTGKTFDWRLLAKISRPYILAGGLNSQNVRSAVQKLHPFGVDVSSGIEDAAGAKNLQLMREFVHEALNCVRG